MGRRLPGNYWCVFSCVLVIGSLLARPVFVQLIFVLLFLLIKEGRHLYSSPLRTSVMLTATRNILTVTLLSAFLSFSGANSVEILSPSSAKVGTDVFRYGLIYYTSGESVIPADNQNSQVFKSIKVLANQSFFKTRKCGNVFFHHIYRSSELQDNPQSIVLTKPSISLVNPGNLYLPFTP